MGELVLRCRGLPFSCKEEQLREFLGDEGIKKIQFTNSRDGRPSGEAFVVVENQESYDAAIKKDHAYMGTRYVEVFGSTVSEMNMYANGGGYGAGARSGSGDGIGSKPDTFPQSDFVVRLRGLPFQCTKDEIRQFFSPLVVMKDGVVFPHDVLKSRSNGEAYVFFEDSASATQALEKNKCNIQHRYIEVFASSRADLLRAVDGGYGGGYGGGSAAWGRDDGYGAPRGGYGGGGYGGGDYGGYGGGYGARDDYGGYGASRGGVGARAPRPTPYDRPDRGGYGAAGGYGGGAASRPLFDRDAGYGGADRAAYGRNGDRGGYGSDGGGGYGSGGGGGAGGYGAGGAANDYGRGYDRAEFAGGYGYGSENGGGGGASEWSGYNASYDYGASNGARGPMRGAGGAGGPAARDSWRNDGIGPRQRGNSLREDKHALKMRGIPFRAVEADIYEFFSPLRPARIELLRESGGRPSGEARVEFSSRGEFDQALQKDKQYMGSRYVELFPDQGY